MVFPVQLPGSGHISLDDSRKSTLPGLVGWQSISSLLMLKKNHTGISGAFQGNGDPLAMEILSMGMHGFTLGEVPLLQIPNPNRGSLPFSARYNFGNTSASVAA